MPFNWFGYIGLPQIPQPTTPITKEYLYLRTFHLDPSVGLIGPPTAHIWEILSGTIYHVTGTDTEVNIYVKLGVESEIRAYFNNVVLAASATGFYPFDLKGSRVIMTDNDLIAVTGNAGCDFDFRVNEKPL